MVDFRSRYDPSQNNQALIQAMAAKAGVKSPLSAGLEAVVPGIEKGLQLSEAMGKIKADRERKAKLAALLATPEGQAGNAQLSGFAEYMKPEDIGSTLAELKMKSDIHNADRDYKSSQTDINISKLEDMNRVKELYSKVNTGSITPSEKQELEYRLKANNQGSGLNDLLGLVNTLQGGQGNIPNKPKYTIK